MHRATTPCGLPATAADIEILELARVEGRVVLTQDLDFSISDDSVRVRQLPIRQSNI
ncbi:MAG: DUF5615 family PIN-like protein [Leptolyngbyaceae bacterium]|nr:DUF5615 family PIN-like protein [Leptolyngbyaceae bacterium]